MVSIDLTSLDRCLSLTKTGVWSLTKNFKFLDQDRCWSLTKIFKFTKLILMQDMLPDFISAILHLVTDKGCLGEFLDLESTDKIEMCNQISTMRSKKKFNCFAFFCSLLDACEMCCCSALNNVCTVCTQNIKYILSLLNARSVLKAYRHQFRQQWTKSALATGQFF